MADHATADAERELAYADARGKALAAPVRPPEVWDTLGTAEAAADRLEDLLEKLEHRLAPVCNMGPTEAALEVAADSRTQVGGRVLNVARRLDMAGSRVAGLLDGLEL